MKPYMKLIRRITWLLASMLWLFMAHKAHAEATYINWGVAFDYPGDAQYSDVQNFAAGRRGALSPTFDYLIEAGAWKDGGHFPGATPSFYGATALGLDLELHEKYVSYYVGPSLLTRRDTILGSHFEVYQKFAIGFRDMYDRRIGFFIKHFSNGGLSEVNYGRNFVGMEVSF